MKNLLIILCSIMCAMLTNGECTAKTKKVKYPGDKTYMFRVTLTDKHGTPFSLSKPHEFLSEKALARRRRQNIAVDSTDLPINPTYVSAINSMGVTVVSRSKWNNTVLARGCNLDDFNRLTTLGCVKEITQVWSSPDSIAPPPVRPKYHTELNRWDTVSLSHHGAATEQTEMLNGTRMHEKGFTGRGMTIAVLDGGFMNADLIPAFRKINIIGWEDFVVPRSKSIFAEMEHGTKVLSVLAVNEPGMYVGSAPDAAYWLLRCEDALTESRAEEDYWAAAAEFADSVGTDIISSSLGFHAFDDSHDNYKYAQLDGHTALISHTASMLAGKGIILVNSAGNDGMSAWKKINVPADADCILTVGAVSPNRRNAAFSSIGPTADGRVKPDVMAPGSPTTVISSRGTIIKDVGTSFATPLVAGLVACLWQALPGKTAAEIIELVRDAGDNRHTPDNIFGFGIPDFCKALSAGSEPQ